jgi:hypothetical protein
MPANNGEIGRKKGYEVFSVKIIKETVEKIDKESKKFITRDVLYLSIENCMANPKTYDFYINSNANILKNSFDDASSEKNKTFSKG